VQDEIESQKKTTARGLETAPLTRRALVGGTAAAIGGTAAFWASSAIIGGDWAPPAAAQMMTNTASPEVVIENFAFNPGVLTVAAGTVVTWVNEDAAPHTVTSDDMMSFASELIETGETFAVEFDFPGTYPYHCSVHPMMTGQVVVLA
jgi:plastocyanin